MSEVPDTNLSAEQLTAMGYRRTSRKFQCINRIDFPDWRERMAIRHAPWSKEEGMAWVACLEQIPGNAEDFYRCVYSSDELHVPSRKEFLKIPPSGFDPVGYIPKDSV